MGVIKRSLALGLLSEVDIVFAPIARCALGFVNETFDRF